MQHGTGELRARKYIRRALEFGMASGYLIPDEDSGEQVLRVSSDIVQLGNERNGSESRADDTIQGRGKLRAPSVKRTVVKTSNNRSKNIRKRGRSRTKSPKKPPGQKRRKNQNDR